MADELERMKAELLEAGYIFREWQVIGHYDFKIEAFTPDKWYYAAVDESEGMADDETVLAATWKDAIEKAYAHLTEKRQNEAMRELLEELANFDESVAKLYTKSQHFERFIEVARRVLGKE